MHNNIIYLALSKGEPNNALSVKIVFYSDGSIMTYGFYETPQDTQVPAPSGASTLIRDLDPVWWTYLHSQVGSTRAMDIYRNKEPISNHIHKSNRIQGWIYELELKHIDERLYATT